MKKCILAVTVTVALLGSAAGYDPEPTETPSPTASATPITMGGCNKAGWNTEVYRFYGSHETMLQNVARIPADLLERRVFLQVTQGDKSGAVKLYERQNSGKFTVTEWTTKQTSRLLADIDRAIKENKAVNCIGEQVKAVLVKDLKEGKISYDIPAPASPSAAFAHSINEATGDFIDTTVMVLC